MNAKNIKLGIYRGLGRYVGAPIRGGRLAALVVVVLLASQGAALAGRIRVTEPETLAGPPGPVRLPQTFEQLYVFGKSSTAFPRSIVDPRWRPRSDWDSNKDLNNFHPSRWYQAPTDPSWEPEPAFTEDDNVTNFNPSRWRMGALDPNWYPKDGFKRQDVSPSSE